MKATIEADHSNGKQKFLVVIRDDAGNAVERISASSVCLTGIPWPALQAVPGIDHCWELIS